METFNFPYNWKMRTGYPKEKNGYSVFSCFSCGGGSTMGYKLAGYTVIGCNEIDPKIMQVYIENHNPKYYFTKSICDLKNKKKFPDVFYNLDILDGSPPCSSFSMAGNREKDWGKSKKFREGQADQILDTLFFDFITLAKKLQPKIVIAENVKGILLGNAIKYVAQIYKDFEDAGYFLFHKLLDASTMGVPQKRQRVFFFGIRKDLVKHIQMKGLFQDIPKLDLKFNCEKIPLQLFYEKILKRKTQNYSDKRFGDIILNLNRAAPTLTTLSRYWIDLDFLINTNTIIKIGTFPQDYNFLNITPGYLIGMSVPPVMMAQISKQVQIQWLDKIYGI